ncbi:hypothetical protein DR62_05930 [Burkholderia thailandensis]|nr:hypothetical protein DR62_05930 [Burkholderia thailandensis]AOJ55537.1 hypothetical protein AQ477_02725 [Burkholderia thailandensis]
MRAAPADENRGSDERLPAIHRSPAPPSRRSRGQRVAHRSPRPARAAAPERQVRSIPPNACLIPLVACYRFNHDAIISSAP